jgi:hypothetical protein
MKAFVDANRTMEGPFDYVTEGKTGGLGKTELEEKLLPWAEAGTTWWIESSWSMSEDQLKERIRQGPPGV